MMQVFDEMTAPSVNGTFLVGKLENYSYDALVDTRKDRDWEKKIQI